MTAQEVIVVIVAVTGCIIALMAAWQAVETLRDSRRNGERPASRRELDRIARKRGCDAHPVVC